MSADLITVVTGILSAGTAASAATVFTSRANARKANAEAEGLDARRPAEVDTIVVKGAEAAVLTMQMTLEATAARLVTVTGERDAALAEVTTLRNEVADLRQKVWDATRATAVAQAAADLLGDRVEQFLTAHHSKESTP